MPTTPQPIRLAAPRIAQLQALAVHYGLPSMASVVAHLINKEIAAGAILDNVPGIEITRHGDEIAIAFGDDIPARLSLAVAEALATTLEDVASGGSGVVNMSAPFSFSVLRRGSAGVNVKVPFGAGEGHTMSADIAHDLARVIRKAVAA